MTDPNDFGNENIPLENIEIDDYLEGDLGIYDPEEGEEE